MRRNRTTKPSQLNAPRRKGRPLPVTWAGPTEYQVPIPRNEKQRLATLHGYGILDTPPEENFDRLARLAAQVCQTPIALITFVDADRQWFKARVGADLDETTRHVAFCAHTILSDKLLEIPDATKDARFANNPLVRGQLQVRFYAGAPLVNAAHHAIGTLCVIDQVPRKLAPAQAEALQALSRQVMSQLDMRRELLALRQQVMSMGVAERNLKKALQRTEATHRVLHRLLKRMGYKSREAAQALLAAMRALPAAPSPRAQKACRQKVSRIAAALLKRAAQIERRVPGA